MGVTSTQLRNYYPVTGRSVTQEVFDRLPVQELAENPYQWTLFILGFAFIKDTPINEIPGVVQPPLNVITSFMEIAAIHGKPYHEWPGDRRTAKDAQINFSYDDQKDMNPFPSRFGGYCHHAAVTFPSWHRPYLMLIEQAIGEYADNIARQIENANPEEGGHWVDAAKQLRFPYWDWAHPYVDKEGLPDLFFVETLRILGPGKKEYTVPNPLISFTFPYVPNDFSNDLKRAGRIVDFKTPTKTYRYATEGSTESNTKALQETLKQNLESARNNVGMLFLFPDGGNPGVIYDEFSNTRNESREEGDHSHTGSLEMVHNSMHGNLGGLGHMGWPDYAAFDPIFYFHHCNVDRLAALWDWCYPDYWMGDGFILDGEKESDKHKWTLQRGAYSTAYHQNIQDDGDFGYLAPFRHPDGIYWTSKETRFFTPDAYPKCDYSYPEFRGVKVDKAPASLEERQVARARIAKCYGVDPQKDLEVAVHAPSWSHMTDPDPDSKEADTKAKPSEGYKQLENFRIFKVLVRLSEHAVGSSYHFNLYYKGKVVGNVTVFAREDNSPCKACAVRRAASSVVQGVITIPPRIINDIIVHSSIPKDERTMKETVKLITQSLSGKIVDLSNKPFASAQGGEAVAAVPAGEIAPKAVHPTEVALLSVAVAEAEKPNLPVQFFDWQRHCDLFPSGWRAEPETPAVAN